MGATLKELTGTEAQEETSAEILMREQEPDGYSGNSDSGDAMPDHFYIKQQRMKELAEEDKSDPVLERLRAFTEPANIWTLDAMRNKADLTGDLDGDGKRLFMFKPLLNTPFVQSRLARSKAYKDGVDGAYYQLMIGYADIVDYLVTKWGVRETVQDMDGNDLYDVDGTVLSIPLPKNRENVDKLTMEELVAFIDAMAVAYSGEANGQR